MVAAIELVGSVEKLGRNSAAIGVFVPGDPRIDQDSRVRCQNIVKMVADILAARDTLKAQGARILGNGEPKNGAHDKPVLFLHPKDFNGTLVELEQA